MENGRAQVLLGISLATVSVVIGLIDKEGLTATFSIIALCLSIGCLRYCSESTYRFSLISSSVVLLCTVLMATLTSYESLVESGVMSRYTWIYVSAIVHTAAVVPLVVMVLFVTAGISGASYNWVVVAGFGWLIGMGIMTMGYTLVNLVQRPDVDAGILANANIVIGLMVSLLVFIAFSLVLRHAFLKNQWLITTNGLEVKQ